MHRFNKAVYFLIIGLMILGTGMMSGCTKKPGMTSTGSTANAPKLQDARSSAEDAEQKLSELRHERIQLEKDLATAKQAGGKKNDSLQKNAK
jgi:outer membrane murein-binding lipoprotein Lpp